MIISHRLLEEIAGKKKIKVAGIRLEEKSVQEGGTIGNKIWCKCNGQWMF
jgi:hypothetical protein